MSKPIIHYGEGGWDKEEGVRALKELRQKTYYIWRNENELKSIDGLALKQVQKLIETAFKRGYIYNPFCGRRIEEIKTLRDIPRCEGCPFLNICYDEESLKAKMSEMTEAEEEVAAEAACWDREQALEMEEGG